jgi:hypothetical protein
VSFVCSRNAHGHDPCPHVVGSHFAADGQASSSARAPLL